MISRMSLNREEQNIYNSYAKFNNRYFPSKEQCFCPPLPKDRNLVNSHSIDSMVSRRKILSKSCDALDADMNEENVWFNNEKLIDDHIDEISNKWLSIDDGIWAKIVVMERNRRVAKAYARVPVLTINGSDDGFDGYRIGLCGFDNPMRDSATEAIKKLIGHGIKIKMDDCGNIVVKRISKSNIYIKELTTNGKATSGVLLEMAKPVKLFNIKKFSANVDQELKNCYPDRRKLESQCISALSFVKDCKELLECSCWVMIINVVALEMLKNKIPLTEFRTKFPPVSKCTIDKTIDRKIDLKENPHRLAARKISTEMKPPRLPSRNLNLVPVPIPDYDYKTAPLPRMPRQSIQTVNKGGSYCCGIEANVSDFVPKRNFLNKSEIKTDLNYGYNSLQRYNEVINKSLDGLYGKNVNSSGKLHLHGRTQNLIYVGEWE